VPTGDSVRGDPTVLRALLRRKADGSRPGERRDGHRIALVISGGGMRGAYTGGMVHALEEHGLRAGFDEVYATSAGAFNAAAFVTGHAWGAARIFHEDLACREFIDVRRALIGRGAVVSMDHLFRVLTSSKPISWPEVMGSPLPLRVVATQVPELTAHAFADLRAVDDWPTAMRAAATIPLLGGRPVAFRGSRWVDGSVSEPLAVARALAAGATHVLALLSRPATELRDVPAGVRPPWWVRALDRVSPGLGTVANGSPRYAENLRMISDAAHPGRGDAHLLAVLPARSCGVGSLTVEPEPLRAASRVGFESLASAVRTLGPVNPEPG
jgi:predicted patatin/cPLA2 family phospholipase